MAKSLRRLGVLIRWLKFYEMVKKYNPDGYDFKHIEKAIKRNQIYER